MSHENATSVTWQQMGIVCSWSYTYSANLLCRTVWHIAVSFTMAAFFIITTLDIYTGERLHAKKAEIRKLLLLVSPRKSQKKNCGYNCLVEPFVFGLSIILYRLAEH